MRDLMRSIEGVDSLNIPKTNTYGLINEITKTTGSKKLKESYEEFEEDYNNAIDDFETKLEYVLELKAGLADLLNHAARSNPENDGVEFKRDYVRYVVNKFKQKLDEIKL